jgi:outer membrane usher protein
MRRSPAPHAPFRLTLCAALLGALGAPGHAQEKPQQLAGSSFNEDFLGIGGDQPNADLSLFSFGNRVLAGKYMVDVSLNQRGAGQSDIRFADKEGKNDAEPCLTRGMLDAWGVNVMVFPELMAAADEACIELTKVIPDADVSYDAGKQRLFVSIPQAALKRSARDAVGPEKWDNGITAAMLDYRVNFARYSGSNYRNDTNPFAPPQNVFDGNPFADRNKTLQRNTLFAGLRAGFNFGDWRFRHFSTYNRGIDGRASTPTCSATSPRSTDVC